jgi:hypothetical protein
VTNEIWRPVIPTGRDEVLTEGFPSQLREALFAWVQVALGVDHDGMYSHRFVDFQNAIRTDLGFTADLYMSWSGSVMPRLRKMDDKTFTNLLDFLAADHFLPQGKQHPLESILSEGGSAWTVVRSQSSARLAKRVPDGVLESVRGVLTAKDAASLKLQEAWLDAHGTNPRASVAYNHAVVAVEIAALSVIPTKLPEPTLASVFSILEAETPTWRLALRDSDKAPGAKSLATMLRTLWRGHESRHGRPDYADATLDEARAAVMLAATLVQWFTSGVVVPIST